MIDKIYKAFLECDRKISTDTRNIIPGSIFFALKGEKFDGNKFVNEALEKGAAFGVIDDSNFKTNKTFLVENVTVTLQQLANFYRKKSRFKIIAITGTNGKTTTKELIHEVLSAKYNCSATKGNLNNHLGVPLTILNTPPETEILIVEMGANHVGEIANLSKIAFPDYGIITNIGKAHLEGFGGFENVIKAKSELYQFLKERNRPVFVNAADGLLINLIKDYNHIVIYGSEDSDCYAPIVQLNNKLIFDVVIRNHKYKISTQLFGRYNINNVLAALCIGIYFNVNPLDAINQIEKYTPQNNRSQIKNTKFNTLVLDSYNANPTSMEAALDSFFDMDAEPKMIILGEMKELGKHSGPEHNKIYHRLSNNRSVKSYFIGTNFYSDEHSNENIFSSTDEFINFLKTNRPEKHLILLKGSRTNGLEKLEKYL